MNRRRRSILVALSSLLVIAMALPVMATEGSSEGTEGAPADTVDAPEPIVTDIEPVVVVTTPTPQVVTADWTYRYLVPTGLALIVLVILITTTRYFIDVVRKRYRIVEE
jgi:hypothetical protein